MFKEIILLPNSKGNIEAHVKLFEFDTPEEVEEMRDRLPSIAEYKASLRGEPVTIYYDGGQSHINAYRYAVQVFLEKIEELENELKEYLR